MNIQFLISKANYITWFKNTNVLIKKEGKVVISVPNAFTKEWLENKYNKFINMVVKHMQREPSLMFLGMGLMALRNQVTSH